MSLAQAYENLSISNHPFPQCLTCKWYGGLDPDDRAFFNEKADEVIKTRKKKATLYRAATFAGLKVAESSFGTHVYTHHHVVSEL